MTSCEIRVKAKCQKCLLDLYFTISSTVVDEYTYVYQCKECEQQKKLKDLYIISIGHVESGVLHKRVEKNA